MFDLSYFGGKSNFKDDCTLNYSLFKPVCRYFKIFGIGETLTGQRSKKLSDETIKPPWTSDIGLY